jgi:hypothetical protein
MVAVSLWACQEKSYPDRQALFSNLFLPIHISPEKFLAQLFKLLFIHVGKLFKESVGRNISHYGKNILACP